MNVFFALFYIKEYKGIDLISSQASIQNTKCRHILGKCYVGKDPICVDSEIKFRDCIKCHKHIQFMGILSFGGHELIYY